jgi:hypothetical protein
LEILMDIPVLKYLDVLIGLAFVMMLGCTVVAAATQVLTSSFYLRAQYLRQGLADLLQQLDPSARPADCQYAAQLIQRHPLVSRSATLFGEATTWFRRWVASWSPTMQAMLPWLPSGAPADTVQRDEFVRILLEWTSGQGVLGTKPELESLRENLRAIVAANGVWSPGETLTAMEHHTIAQERAFPGRPAHLWKTAALIDACPARLAGKITGWFDAMAMRTSQRFTLQSKLITSAVALFFVIALPLDSLDLIRRLSDNPQAREQLVQLAQQHVARAEAARAPEQLQTAQGELDAAKAQLAGALQPLQLSSFDIRKEWDRRLPGLLLSWALLTLGTPFWYDLLKNLLKLRSVLAQKDDKERAERQEEPAAPAQAAAGTIAAAAGAAAGAGVIAIAALPENDDEAGDLEQMAAVG